jgi:imidazole glycerol phosphate synthase subunit HisF
MQKAFKHPLARKATTAKARLRGGGEETLLIVLTTMDLDASAKGFNRKNFDRLNDAAQAFVAESEGLAGYAILNRPKEWDA